MNTKNISFQSDEGELVSMASNGDLDAFNQLVLAYQNMAYNLAYTLLGDSDTAEDATQESFIKVYQNIGRFRGGSFRAWLLRIVKNTSYDLLRQSKRRHIQPLFPENEDGDEVESPAWLVDPSTSVQAVVEQTEDSTRLYQALDELPEVYRSVLTLVDLYELDYVEAAKVLKVPLGTVKSRLARARLQMQKKLKDCTDSARSFTGRRLDLNPCASS
jgi:RNA polymerase sigma-70 factor (ECF subfamily)